MDWNQLLNAPQLPQAPLHLLATTPFSSLASHNIQQSASNVPYPVPGHTSSNVQNVLLPSQNPGPPQCSLHYSHPSTIYHLQLHRNPLPRAPFNSNIAPAQKPVNYTRGSASGVSQTALPAPQCLSQCAPSSTVLGPAHSSSTAPAPSAPTPALQPLTGWPKPKPKDTKAKACKPPAPVAPTVAIASDSHISVTVSSLLNSSSSTQSEQFGGTSTPLPMSPHLTSHPPSPQNSLPPPCSCSSSPEQGVTSLRKKEQPVQSDPEEGDGIPTVRGKMGAAEKEIAGSSTSEKLRDTVKVLLDNLDEGIRKAASEEKVSVLRVKQLISIHMSSQNHWGNSIFNAAVHQKAEEMNAGHQKGHWYKLTEIIELVH
ncbi:hypothetical protein Moror_2253 [Moniliophthora roreri MCA 2997]|uniref:Uncharacterized protein n=1 Tax=Moniliophthora roreri (strain MCA 2997) TaxID=1381753 RepID=V2WL16_MONRO|nr:hypothetical protein Moror_2253 [Moniliophthora roreri MCA 2997]